MTHRIATYRRVSTDEQTTNHSLESQASILRAFADQQGYTVARDYVDGGWSGSNRERPALEQLLADAKEGLFETVLIYRLDRLARSTYLAYSLIQELADLGVGVRSYSEPQIDSSTPMGKVSLGVTAIFAELERDTFMQRSRDGTRKAVKEGKYVGGITAYGYQAEDKQLVVYEPEAEIVRMIFSWVGEQGWSTTRVAQELTRLNIPTKYRRDGRGIRGKDTATYWRAGGVLRLLKNTTYKGEYRYGKRNTKGHSGKDVISVPCAAIVSPELWDAAQATLQRNALTATRNAKHTYMLKSLIKCGGCGCTYIGTRGKKWQGYACSGRSERSGKEQAARCRNPGLAMRDIEGEIWQHICELLSAPERHLEQRPPTLIPAELPLARTALAESRESRKRLTDLYLDPNGPLSKAEYLERLAGLDTQIAELESRISQLSDTAAQEQAYQQQAEELRALAQRYQGELDTADDGLRQTLAHHLVQRITVGADGGVDVEWVI